MNIVKPLDLAAPESPQNQQSVGTKGVNHMSHHAIEHRLVLQRHFIWQGDFREQLEPDNVLP